MSQDYPSSYSAYQVNTSLHEEILDSLAYDWNATPATEGLGETSHADGLEANRIEEPRGKTYPALSRDHVSQPYSPYQTSFAYNNGPLGYDSYAPTASSTYFTQTPSRSVTHVPENHFAPSNHTAYGTIYDSRYVTQSQANKAAESSSRIGNTLAIPSSYTQKDNYSGNEAVDVLDAISDFDEGENADVAEEGEEDEDQDEDKEDLESVRAPQEGRDHGTHEEDDEDGTPVVVIDPGRKGRGKIGTKNGVDVYFNPTLGKWQEYLTHDSMRDALINKAQAEYPGEKYRHPDPSSGGGALYGVTSFFKDHQNWGSEKNRDDLPDCVFKWPTDKERAKDLSLGDLDDDAEDELRRSRKDYPGPMMWGNKILLDHRNLPVADHDIPATLSGNTPGYKLQAMRLLNPNITQYDLLARMPRQIERKKKGVVFVKALGTKNTHINMRMQRFRDTAGCIAGAVREGSTEIMAGLLKLFAHHDFDPTESGSTRGFGRNLDPWERKEVKLGNAGKYSRRSGKRALGQNKRKEVHDKMLKSIETGKRKEAARAGMPIPIAQNNGAGATSQPSQGQPAQMGTMGIQTSRLGPEMQAQQNSDDGASPKRRRDNGTPGTEPRPSRRYPRIERIHQPQRYGVAGAPAPFASSAQLFGGLQDSIDFDVNAALGFGNYPGNGQVFNAEPDTYPPNGGGNFVDEPVHHDAYPSFYDEPVANVDGGSSSYTDENSGLSIIADYLKQNASDVPMHQPSNLQPTFEGYQTQQILGKHGRAEPVGQPHEDVRVPQPSLGEQGLEEQVGGEGVNNDMPASKRPRMPTTEGYYSPPAQAPKAELLKQARKSERDAHLPPVQFNVNEAIPATSEDAQVEAPSKPSQLVMNGSVINLIQVPETEDAHLPQVQPNNEEEVPQTDKAPQVADAQGPDPPRAPVSARTEQEVRSDIRDVRPANGWQSQSLNDALRYTREAYLEWTGEEAPATNLEDSYNVQYRALRAAFKAWWKSEANPQRLEPLPELYRMKAWGGAVEDWKAPENVEHLFEPMRRGKWAARNEDGSLQEPQFRWNCEEYDWCNADDVGQL